MAGAVLAGGPSRRMGRDKGLLQFGGRPLIQAVLDAIRPLFPEIMIVCNDSALYGGWAVPVVPDRIPAKGPLGGVHGALCASRLPYIFCVACDMPFLNPDVIAHLCRLAPGYDAVVPRTDAGWEPLHAVYGRACLPQVERMLRDDRLRVDALLGTVRVRPVDAEELRALDPGLRSFVNVNTPEALEAARTLLDRNGEATCTS